MILKNPGNGDKERLKNREQQIQTGAGPKVKEKNILMALYQCGNYN
jgi:hypothetical protein